MYNPLFIKTDYSLMNSLISLKKLKETNINTFGIVDDNMSYVMEYYLYATSNNKKLIIGLEIIINNNKIYLYPTNYDGYLNLIKINNIKIDREITLTDLKLYHDNIIAVVDYDNISIYDDISTIFDKIYICYKNDFEKNNAILKTKLIVFGNLTLCLNRDEVKYLRYLNAIKDKVLLSEVTNNYENNYLLDNISEEDIQTTIDFSSLIDVKLELNKMYIPEFPSGEEKLIALIKKGLTKRLDGSIPNDYLERIKYEFSVIKEMGFINYFMIVYDYVLYAKKHNIYVGPGRGSAAGSLICYSLGITEIDPLKYNLLFERFLNKERVTLPDIDIDFEASKRDSVINYVRDKYGIDNVCQIVSYDTLKSRQAIRDIGKVLDIEPKLIDNLCKLIDAKLSLKDNLKNKIVVDYITKNNLKQAYKNSIAIENLKKHHSTHAAGIVISSKPLKEIIPLVNNGEFKMTGWTMEYLETSGLIKMDILALENLTIITGVKELIKHNLKEDIDLNTIPLDDPKTIDLFNKVDTLGIFQFESRGMINFLKKLKVNSFNDLIAASALFRPGPMDNIDSYIRRREGKEEINYFDERLKPILESTYGIIVYQEQVLEILKLMGGYSYAEADIIRRAMSKKKMDILEKERIHFINNAVSKKYDKDISIKVFDYIMKFGNYGFNKAHSVAYALIGYQMGYLKANYRVSFMANALNLNIGSEIKTKLYIDECKRYDIKVLKPSINNDNLSYKIDGFDIIMPLSTIKGIGTEASTTIINHAPYNDYFDFISKCYGTSVNKKTIESLINAGALDSFKLNHQTMINNIDNVITYSELINNLNESLVEKPLLDKYDEYSEDIIMKSEIESFGFYLTNHPASKFQNGIIKSNNIITYFDKFIKTIILIENISKIKTKKNEDMAFIDGSDEYGTISYTLFPKNINLLLNIKKGSLVEIMGKVSKRFDKYQIIVSNINLIK